jgi:hypothetical protein
MYSIVVKMIFLGALFSMLQISAVYGLKVESIHAITPSSNMENSKEGVIIVEGKYQDRNVYIANGWAQSGVGFCAYEVRVNGNLIIDEVNSSAFEVDLSLYNLRLGDDVIIEIRHKTGCEPKVLNPGSLKPSPTFETVDIKISPNGILEWVTKNETGSLPYIVQQYKWNKWIDIGQVQGIGTSEMNNYAFYVDFNSGNNKFRVIQFDQTGKIKKSNSTEIEAEKPVVNFVYNKKSKEIVFSSETIFEIHDEYGNLVMKGFGTSSKIHHLSNGLYWLSYDNITESFEKK